MKDETVGEHGVASQGRTREEALENLDETVAFHKVETGDPVFDGDPHELGIDPESILDGSGVLDTP